MLLYHVKTQADHSETLLAEVVVDVGGLHGQVSGGVEGNALVLRRIIRSLTHSKQVYKGEKSLSFTTSHILLYAAKTQITGISGLHS